MNNNYNPDLNFNHWERALDRESNRYYYVNHVLKTTQWLDPMDQLKKPASFAECEGDQLPYGWDKINDPKIGIYYTNHLEKKNQIDDPRLEWHNRRRQMLSNYLKRASNNNNNHHINQSRGTDHHRSCLEVGPTKNEQSHKFSSRPNLIFGVNTDRVEQNDIVNNFSTRLVASRPGNVGSSRSSLPNEIPCSSNPTQHSMTEISIVAEGKYMNQSVASGSKEFIRLSADNIREANHNTTEKNENLMNSYNISPQQSIDVVKEDLDSNDKLLEIMDRFFKRESSFSVEV